MHPMRARVAVAALLCAGASAASSPGFDPSQVSVAPSLPPGAAEVRMAPVASDVTAFDGPLPSLTWSVGTDTRAILGAAWKGDQLLPSIGLQRRLLAQESAGIDVAVSAAFRSVGREDAGSEVAFAVQLTRSFGLVSWATSAALGKGTAGRSDVDFEAASLFAARVTRQAKIGILARLRGELVDDLDTAEDHGRSLGVLVAPALSLAAGAWAIDLLAGWERPRGAAADRVTSLVVAAYNF
jgi:hypothetical protein